MRKQLLTLAFSTLVLFTACNSGSKESVQSHVLTAEHVASMTPDQVIDSLKIGNQAFAERHLHGHDYNAQLEESLQGQHPMAIVLSCIDSRVPVETVFDMGLGDLFVARVAGNVINEDMLGSMEYACEHTGSKVVVVLGHESCGAVHAACEGVEAGNMTKMLDKIKPAIDSCLSKGCHHSSPEFEEEVVKANVLNMVERVRSESTILSHMEEKGEIKIVGAIFNLHTGIVSFL